ncbi:hypothetical protein PoB_006606100 [Plakobranchus ocellatus]|uniref:BZIP domain-containing protein n=1 Tax=Plakobranchus ocellatus TaxID=259542 RepID=A0AAV4D6J1_9GAST|nr:hypothetical protein PoB_006606100 [Plakobranchus ocellatus]
MCRILKTKTRKRPRDMYDEERRAHNAELRRQSRARQNPQKKRWAKVKAAQYSQKYRETAPELKRWRLPPPLQRVCKHPNPLPVLPPFLLPLSFQALLSPRATITAYNCP